MSITINLKPQQEAQLKEAAAKQGVSLAEYVSAMLEWELPTDATLAGVRATDSGDRATIDTGVVSDPRNRARKAGKKFYEVATSEEWIAELQRFGKSLGTLPDGPMEALRRENLYEDCL